MRCSACPSSGVRTCIHVAKTSFFKSQYIVDTWPHVLSEGLQSGDTRATRAIDRYFATLSLSSTNYVHVLYRAVSSPLA